LQARPGFIQIGMNLLALFVGDADDPQGGAVIYGCQAARVAVMQNFGALRNVDIASPSLKKFNFLEKLNF